MIITIDGPAGSGKSSTARAVARALAIRHLDSGAFYRALTLAALDAGIPVERWNELTSEQLDALGVQATQGPAGYVFSVRGRDITQELRSERVNAAVSRMAAVPAVRHWLFEHLRAAARGTDLVADGRDMGTVVFPEADLKVFLTCDLESRARRKLRERGVENPDADALQAEMRSLAERDRLDSSRSHSPLRPAPDAVRLDTSNLTFDEQVARVVDLVRGIDEQRKIQ